MKKIKEFHDTGVCIPERHYMADISNKFSHAWNFIKAGKYFIINRPRQYGKTTMLHLLTQRMKQDSSYLPLKMSFAGMGDVVFEKEEWFIGAFLNNLVKQAKLRKHPSLAEFILKKIDNNKIENFEDLASIISDLTDFTEEKIVLLIDEVDKSSNNQLFISFLAMLRDKYLDQLTGDDSTFHSIILAGLHDIKTLKLKIRPEAQKKYNSPWNIAADFDIEMGFFPHEIVPMLEDYQQHEGVKMDSQKIAEKLYHYTNGYPFLVSKLCKIIAEKLLKEKSEKTWTEEDVTAAFKLLIQHNNANLDSLVKSLENNPELYDLVYQILVQGESTPFNPHHPIIHWGVLHGIFQKGGELRVHNRVYQEVIYNYMVSKTMTSKAFIRRHSVFGRRYLLPGNRLNLEKVLNGFQDFMKAEFNEKDRTFLERHGRLVFLAHLKPIINGSGYDFKEPQISEEKRLDIVLTFYQHRYLLELKRWMGQKAHLEGLEQLVEYLNFQNLDEGYLIIFNTNKIKKFWTSEWIDYQGKRIYTIWV